VTFFVDANVLVYSAGESEYRDPCLEIVAAVAAGGVAGRSSTAALEEVFHAELSGRADRMQGLAGYAYGVLTPLLPVTDEVFRRALEVDAPQLGANDRVHVATCLLNDIDVIVSADRGFDGVKGIRRVDPLDERARRRLLSSPR
jgi:predicted nucleic acid-binding protein